MVRFYAKKIPPQIYKVFKGNSVDVDFLYVKVCKGFPSNPGRYSATKCELVSVL